MFTRGGKQYNSQLVTLSYRGCLYGGRPALLAGLGLVKGLDFTSRTWENPPLLLCLARLAETPALTKFIFPRNPEFDIWVQVL